MKMIYEHYSGKSYDEPLRQSGKNRVKAIHYIQSFSPDENITPEQAHRIAKAFVRKTFGDDVQVVIATHCDKAHVHSHIVINSYSVAGTELTPELMNELIDRIEVHAPDKSSGHRRQTIDIYFRFNLASASAEICNMDYCKLKKAV